MERVYALWYQLYLYPAQSPMLQDGAYYHATQHTQTALIRIANAAWDLRTELVLGRVASIITPFSVIYRTDAGRDALVGVHQATTFFIWMPVKDFLGRRAVRGAQYVVLFQLLCDDPYKTLCLARAILEFPSTYIAFADGHRFDMVNLCFSFSKRGAYGAFFFDRDLFRAYNKVKKAARAKARLFDMYNQRYPVTIWRNSPGIVTFSAGTFQQLEGRVRYVAPDSFGEFIVAYLALHIDLGLSSHSRSRVRQEYLRQEARLRQRNPHRRITVEIEEAEEQSGDSGRCLSRTLDQAVGYKYLACNVTWPVTITITSSNMENVIYFTLDLHYLSSRPGFYTEDLDLILPEDDLTCLLSKETGRDIVKLANVAVLIGSDPLLGPLSSLLTHDSIMYKQILTPPISYHIRYVTQYAFIWMPAAHYQICEGYDARFAVKFFIFSPTSFLSLALAYMITHFMQMYHLLGDRRFSLLDITYQFDGRGVYGVLFFDEGLEWAYDEVLDRVVDDTDISHGIYYPNGGDLFAVNAWNCPVIELSSPGHLMSTFNDRAEDLVTRVIFRDGPAM
ncbi:hypothetical protein MD484_g8124, partial [Candolleomyces efflorescens]